MLWKCLLSRLPNTLIPYMYTQSYFGLLKQNRGNNGRNCITVIGTNIIMRDATNNDKKNNNKSMWKKVAGKILSVILNYKNVLWQETFRISKKRWNNLILPKQSHFYVHDTLTETSPGWWHTKWIKSRLMIHKLNEVQPNLIMFTLPWCFKPHPLLLHRNPAHVMQEFSEAHSLWVDLT